MYRRSSSHKVFHVFVPVLVFTLLTTSAQGIPSTSTFDTGTDGWTWASGLDAAFTWESSGGNPGGYILYDDNKDTGPASGIYAPADYLGDWQASGVTNLTYETIIFSTGSVYQLGHYQVWLSGPAGSAKWIGPDPDASAGWLLIDVPMTESEWVIESGSWDDLLADVTELYIHMEYYNNWGPFEIVGIDNVSLNATETASTAIPAPGAVGLSAFGIACVSWLRRRRKL